MATAQLEGLGSRGRRRRSPSLRNDAMDALFAGGSSLEFEWQLLRNGRADPQLCEETKVKSRLLPLQSGQSTLLEMQPKSMICCGDDAKEMCVGEMMRVACCVQWHGRGGVLCAVARTRRALIINTPFQYMHTSW
jgi:hypothetical protein